MSWIAVYGRLWIERLNRLNTYLKLVMEKTNGR